MQRFRGGIEFEAGRLCVSLNSRLESNKEERVRHDAEKAEAAHELRQRLCIRRVPSSGKVRVEVCGFGSEGLGFRILDSGAVTGFGCRESGARWHGVSGFGIGGTGLGFRGVCLGLQFQKWVYNRFMMFSVYNSCIL